MLRKVVAASLVLVLCAGVVFAERFGALITKVEGNKVSFYKMEGKGKDAKKTGDEITLPAAKDIKVVQGFRKGEEPQAVEGGLRNKRFTSISEKGVRALITTDDDNKKITEIRVFGGRGKGKQ